MFSNYICSYLKHKKNFFFRKSIIEKNKGGGAGDLVGEKRNFLGRQKFLVHGVVGGSKNRPGANFGHVAHSTLRNFTFNEKQKSYASWKLCNAKKIKNHGCPPPFGTQCPYSPGLSWDVKRNISLEMKHFYDVNNPLPPG